MNGQNRVNLDQLRRVAIVVATLTFAFIGAVYLSGNSSHADVMEDSNNLFQSPSDLLAHIHGQLAQVLTGR